MFEVEIGTLDSADVAYLARAAAAAPGDRGEVLAAFLRLRLAQCELAASRELAGELDRWPEVPAIGPVARARRAVAAWADRGREVGA